MDDGISKGFWIKGALVIVGLGALALIVFVAIDRLIYRYGAIGALLIVGGILMVFAYYHDRKKQREWDSPGS